MPCPIPSVTVAHRAKRRQAVRLSASIMMVPVKLAIGYRSAFGTSFQVVASGRACTYMHTHHNQVTIDDPHHWYYSFLPCHYLWKRCLPQDKRYLGCQWNRELQPVLISLLNASSIAGYIVSLHHQTHSYRQQGASITISFFKDCTAWV